jgi:DNA-binding response OmpR family regulator
MTSTARVLVVLDHNAHNLEVLARVSTEHGYQVRTAASLDAFDAVLDGPSEVGLVMVDVAGFGPDIWTRCQRAADAGVPLLLMSARASSDLADEGLARGARAVLQKPLPMARFLGLLRTFLDA